MATEPDCAVCGHRPAEHPGHDCEDPCMRLECRCQGYAPKLVEYLEYQGSRDAERLPRPENAPGPTELAHCVGPLLGRNVHFSSFHPPSKRRQVQFLWPMLTLQ